VGAEFTQDADFIGATFTQAADFSGARFTQAANFAVATFEQAANFRRATFTQAADFSGARFTQAANFAVATFEQAAHFIGATFTQAANFSVARFTQAADFRFAKFLGAVEFRETVFTGDPKLNPDAPTTDELAQKNDFSIFPGPVFSGAHFEKPELVTFYQTYLGLALFHNCEVSKCVFSDVTWLKRKGSGKRIVFEEIVDLNYPPAGALSPQKGDPNERNYSLIAELYQQLKKNYDDKRDYWTAGDFHYGEMEMKRLSSPRRNKALRWLHRNLGLVAWYKYASEYGENYVVPAVWLMVVLLGLALLYPLAGLTQARSVPQATAADSERGMSQVGLVEAYSGPNMMTTVGVAFFQRDLEYRPAYPWGRALSWLQLLLTYTLVALFLLALRRQFRR
jgi:hypothetical protein